MIIVFVAYKIPLARLAEHFAWNDKNYRAAAADVLAVVDPGTYLQLGMQSCHILPIYARVFAYPNPLPVFSLAKTANYGIRKAVLTGDTVIKTDVDCFFTEPLLNAFAGLQAGRGIAPVYRMVPTIEVALSGQGAPWPASRGTIGLVAADWQKLCGYNENFAGYGCEDGDLWDRAMKAGIKFSRPAGLFHVAPPAGRYWNRAGENPENHAENNKFRGKLWNNENWGLL
jgi:hypothetical protein